MTDTAILNRPFEKWLKAGKLSVMYQNATLRYVSLNGEEVIRTVYSAVRDQNWLTAKLILEKEEIVEKENSFQIQLVCSYAFKNEVFKANVSIYGTEESEIIYQFEGVVTKPFLKNRIGICVLHPIAECIGQSVKIIHSNNENENTIFPESISPHQPFMDVSGMEWLLPSGNNAELKLEGDIFETEDQRNWTDASFKTYSTPLGIPFPVEVEIDHKVSQKVHLKVFHNKVGVLGQKQKLNLVSLDMSQIKPFPQIGIGSARESQNVTAFEKKLVADIPFSHIRVDLELFKSGWKEKLLAYPQIEFQIEAVLFFDGEYEICTHDFIDFISGQTVNFSSILLFDVKHKCTPSALLNMVLPILKKQLPKVDMGAGTDAFFAELNRKRDFKPEPDFLSYSINPQVHAEDLMSLAESIDAQGDTVKTALQFFPNIHISPVSLKRRNNPDAIDNGGNNSENIEETLPWNVDPRQATLFNAGWTLASIQNMALAGAKSLTYFELSGMRGLFLDIEQTVSGRLFPSKPGHIFPVYLVLKELLGSKPKHVVQLTFEPKLLLSGLAVICEDDSIVTFITSFSSKTLEVSLDIPGSGWFFKELNDHNFKNYTLDPGLYFLKDLQKLDKKTISISPYSIITLKSDQL